MYIPLPLVATVVDARSSSERIDTAGLVGRVCTLEGFFFLRCCVGTDELQAFLTAVFRIVPVLK